MVELRLPNINGTDREQLIQMRSYLYQLIPQLQWALNNVSTASHSQGEKVVQKATQVMVPSSQAPFDAEVAFEAMKSLIIKSAEIVEAYYDEINSRLEGLYVARSDFGDFIEKTEQDIKATSTYVEQKFGDVQVIISEEIDGLNYSFNSAIDATDSRITEEVNNLNNTYNSAIDEINTSVSAIDGATSNINAKVDATTGEVENLKAVTDETTDKVKDLDSAVASAADDIRDLKVAILEANAYIRSGLLYYGDNSFPVYGLEIGQRNTVNGEEVFNKYARFTSDRLSFYDQNDSEVAYISDYKLYIRNVEITDSFKIGGYKDIVKADGGVITKWVGGNG